MKNLFLNQLRISCQLRAPSFPNIFSINRDTVLCGHNKPPSREMNVVTSLPTHPRILVEFHQYGWIIKNIIIIVQTTFLKARRCTSEITRCGYWPGVFSLLQFGKFLSLFLTFRTSIRVKTMQENIPPLEFIQPLLSRFNLFTLGKNMAKRMLCPPSILSGGSQSIPLPTASALTSWWKVVSSSLHHCRVTPVPL